MEGNPAETGEIFTDKCSYISKVGNSKKQRRKTELKIANEIRPLLDAELKANLINKEATCKINGVEHKVIFVSQGITEATQSMQGTSSYWLKNEILPKISEYIQNGKYIQRAESDATHNTRKQTIKLKQRTDYFYYFKTTLPDGQIVYISIGHYRADHPNLEKADKFYFYTITKQEPRY